MSALPHDFGRIVARTKRDLERRLRAAGATRREAETIASRVTPEQCWQELPLWQRAALRVYLNLTKEKDHEHRETTGSHRRPADHRD